MDGSINQAFWIGLAIAIPLSIVGNLLTPLVQRGWASRSEKSRSKQLAVKLKEYELLQRYAAHREEFNDFQFTVILKITLINAFAGGASALLSSFGSGFFIVRLGIDSDALGNSFFVAANFVVALAALITINIARQAWRYNHAVKDLEAFAERNGLARERKTPPEN